METFCDSALDAIAWVYAAHYHPMHDRLGVTTARLYAMTPREVCEVYFGARALKAYNRRDVWYLRRRRPFRPQHPMWSRARPRSVRGNRQCRLPATMTEGAG